MSDAEILAQRQEESDMVLAGNFAPEQLDFDEEHDDGGKHHPLRENSDQA